MTSLRKLPLYAAAGALLCSAAAVAQNATPSVRITAPINANQLITLKGSVHPLANAQNDRGVAPGDMQLDRLHLVLKRSPAQETALKQLILEQHTPGSPNYHKWLTPAEFGAQFGPSSQDIDTVENWLTSQGFTVNKIEPGRQTLDISGNVAQLGTAFHTQIHKYMVNGQIHYANANVPSVPAALAPVIGGFVSLNNFHFKSYATKLGPATYDPATGRAHPSWTIGNGTAGGDYFVLSPADFATQYDLTPLYNAGIKGDGQTIAIVNESNININLVNQFRSTFGLPANPPHVIIDGNDPGIDGVNNPDGLNYASDEAYLDTEWAGAVAPDATIDLVIAGDTSLETGLLLAAEHAVYSNVAPVVSLSFGLCEAYLGSYNGFFSSLWEQAAAQGQTVVVSTGDSGAAGCDDPTSESYAVSGLAVSGIASTPYNVAVGGTDFYYSSWNSGSSAIDTQLSTYWTTTASNTSATASIKGYIPEQPWNDSQYGLNLFSYYSQNNSTTIGGTGGGASSAALCSGTYSSTFNSTTNSYCSVKPTGYPKPAWQTGTGVPTDGVRDTPDVSLFASDGWNNSFYPICASDGDCQSVSSGIIQFFGIGGTSAAAPSFAGIMALVNQKYGRQGQANTILYPLKTQFPAAFHDVIHGTNSVPCAYSATANLNSPNCIAVVGGITLSGVLEGQLGTGTTATYNAAAGYNQATGLGTIDAANLVNDWGNVTLTGTSVTLSPSSASFTHGTAVSFTGSVTASSGTPTGDVVLMTDSPENSQQGQVFFTLNNGSFDSATNFPSGITTLPGGSYNIWASYGGDSKNAASVSQKHPITVTPENSGIAFGLFGNATVQYYTSTASPGTSVDYGTQLMLSARVAPAADVATIQSCTTTATTCPTYTYPTGAVTFKDSSTTLNTAVLNSQGDAEYNAPFSVGAHSVTASYAGDNSYNPSTTASPIAFTVVQDTPQLVIGASAVDTSLLGAGINGPNQPLVITVQVLNTAQSSAAASSSVYPVPVAAPTGTITATGLPSGVPTTATLSPATDPVSLGGYSLGGTQAVEGVANFVVPAGTTQGTYNVTFTYGGDSNYKNNSISATIPIENTNGDGAPTPTITATLSGSVSPSSTLTVSGTVAGVSGHPAPDGTGQFGMLVYASGYYINQFNFAQGSGTSSNFSFTFDSRSLPQGANQITLQYTGDNVYNPVAIVLNSGNTISNPLSDFTIVPESTVVPVTSTAAGTDTLNLASINGFNGSVSLSCTAPSGITCTVPSSASLASGSATATVNISAAASVANGAYNIAIKGTDSTGQYIHVVNIQAAVTGTTAAFALTNSGNITVGQGATTNNTSNITVSPSNSFNGTVYLSCVITSRPASATSPATCIVTPTVNISSASPQTATLTVNTVSNTTTGNYTVTVKGAAGSVSATTPVTVTVNAAVNPSFTLAASAPAAISAGASATSTITATGSNSYAGSISFSCQLTTAPTGAQHEPTCSIPGTVTLSSTTTSGTATATVTTTAPTTSMNGHKSIFWPAGGGTVLACLVFFWIPKKRRSWLAMVILLVFFISMAGMACGGGGGGSSSGGGTTTTPGTTSGSYIFTVTATGNPAVTPAPTQTFTVKVN